MLGLLTLVSFALSVLNVVWVAVVGLVVLVLGAGSWLAGPAVGMVGLTIAGFVLMLLVLQSLLSLLLFAAAWKTWAGEPAGRSLHKTWAWATILIDLVDLAFTGGMEPGAWVRLIYAVVLIAVMNRDDVRDYFDQARFLAPPPEKAFLDDQWP